MAFNQEYRPCFLCGRPATEEHHAFEGNSRRKLSERYKLKIWLCVECHRTGKDSVHHSPRGPQAMAVKVWAQRKFAREHRTREDFIRIFQTNVLE